MKQLKILITDESGTVLDSEIMFVRTQDEMRPDKLKFQAIDIIGDMNWNRISNLISEE